MDNYRRQPPREGFSRPSSLGGYDDDEVEGHTMRLNNSPEDDTEGHKFKAKRLTDEDDTEGHKFRNLK